MEGNIEGKEVERLREVVKRLLIWKEKKKLGRKGEGRIYKWNFSLKE